MDCEQEEDRVQTAACARESDRKAPGSEGHAAQKAAAASAFTPLPDIRVKPPGSTTPPDVFNTVPLLVEQGCQEGALLCTCTDTAEEEEEEEEEDGVDCVVPGRLDMVSNGFIRSWRNRDDDPASLQLHQRGLALCLPTPDPSTALGS